MDDKPKDYQADRRNSPYSNTKEHWHLSKGVNVSMILTVVIGLGAGLIRIENIDNNTEKNTIEINHVKETQQIQNDNISREIKEFKDSTQKQYENVNEKLDKLIERELSSNV